MALREKLAEFGFESNEDYDFALRSLFAAAQSHLRTLNVDGYAGRRKTAFANALAHALEYPHILYHDFSQPDPVAAPAAPAPVAVAAAGDSAESVQPDEPVPAFERIVAEACAYSEADRTVLILDQLQAAPFADQLRLYHFIADHQWAGPTGAVAANPRNLLVVLVSEQPLYHSLARVSFRVWTDIGHGFLDYAPADFGLGPDARELFTALGAVFKALDASPTPGEFRRILGDVLTRVHGEEQLRQAIFGWTEGIDHARLYSPDLTPPLRIAAAAIESYRGIEHVEL